ncbi:hypothetical protein PO909_020146 [Leuciscus waleckii]
MLWSLEEGTLWTDSCPRLLATMATALNLLRVPVLGLLAFCRLSLSSVLRLMDRWSVQTNDTCIPSQRMLGYHRENSVKEWSLQKTKSQLSASDHLAVTSNIKQQIDASMDTMSSHASPCEHCICQLLRYLTCICAPPPPPPPPQWRLNLQVHSEHKTQRGRA